MGIIIAAGALFTAVYDVLYRYNSSNTTNLNAATMDKRGQAFFGVEANGQNSSGTIVTFDFDEGTYMVLFGGTGGANDDWNYFSKPAGATCIAFYKGSNMVVHIGADYSTDSNYHPGHGKTKVVTNFALPGGYSGNLTAIAAGAGGAASVWTMTDGTFAGWEANSYSETGLVFGSSSGYDGGGMPATQNHNGYRYDNEKTRHILNDGNRGYRCSAGGAGYYDGGAGYYIGAEWRGGGGGSCTPWCYPVYSSDIQNGPRYPGGAVCNWYDSYNGTNRSDDVSGNPARHLLNWDGAVYFYRIDPYARPSGSVVAYGNGDAWLNAVWTDRYTPVTALQNIPGNSMTATDNNMGRYLTGYDCGIRTGWVYSVSEDGKSWHGVGPDGERSETSDTQ